MTTFPSNNTKTKKNKKTQFKAHTFQFTLNKIEKYKALKNDLLTLKTYNYFISYKEKTPTTKHKHIHIYVHFNQTYKISKKIIKHKAHIKVYKNSPKQNITYIKKNEKILNKINKKPTQGIKSIKKLKKTNINNVSPMLYNIKEKINNKTNKKDIFNNILKKIKKNNLKEPEIIYICGDSGKDKTYKTYKITLNKFSKKEIKKLTIENNFIQITKDKAKCYVIKEFKPNQIKTASFLQLTDKYDYTYNIKESFKSIHPKYIIITSIIKPKDLYKNKEINKQFTRKITEIINLGYKEKDKNKYILNNDL